MRIVILQWLDEHDEYKNKGGLFLNVDHISAMVPLGTERTRVILSNGKNWIVPWGVVELIDELRDVAPMVPTKRGVVS